MKNLHILPTDKPSRLSFDFDDNKYLLTNDLVLFDNQNLLENRNIYITSDDEIKENNTHFYNLYSGQLHISGNHTDYIAINKNGCKKIIATTDVSLGLPQPSDSFIKKYIEEYNKGSVITNVLVEYELISNEEYFLNTINPDENVPYFDENLKINPKDNTITIKKIKDSWNREEVEKLCKNAIEFGWAKGDTISKEDIPNWIKENL